MGYWLIFLAGDAALGCYVASLWVRGHAALQGAAPHGLLSDQQQQFAEWAAVLALYNTAHLYPALAFHVLGPLLEGRGSGRSLVER